MERTDQALIDEALAGALEAYDLLMQRYERLVYKVAYGIGRHREAALDISQNAFLKAYQGLASFRSGSNFKTWLVRIAYNEGINWLRSQRRHQNDHQPFESSGHLASQEADQESALLHNQRRAQIVKGMERLNGKYRLAVTLRYFQGMPIKEVAAVLQCSEGTAKNILFRSVQRLRDSLATTA